VATEGVDAAYGESKSYLEPLRSLWEGTEGILWLLSVPNATAAAAASGGGGGGTAALVPGAFYLDRSPQPKHIAGPFFSEGSFTKNTPAEVQDMMAQLQAWSSAATRPSKAALLAAAARKLPMVASTVPVDLPRFMIGWRILAHIPTPFELEASNCIENYVYNEADKCVDVDFTFHLPNKEKKPKTAFIKNVVRMRGRIQNAPVNTLWGVDPRYGGLTFPIGLSYLLLYTAPDYSFAVVGVPDRSYLWVMVRDAPTEHTVPAMPVREVYPELADLFPASTAAPTAAGAVPSVAEKVAGIKAQETVSGSDVSNVSTAGSAAAITGALEEKRRAEVEILRQACAVAVELGHDINKILRCCWINDINTTV
jgi:lipocalin